ncbi:Hsp70 family protein [Prochlorococcus marinus]|uniref:Putative DnaK-type molecular chaperone (HSP70 family) n=1 Tax=Prochlorococcus marinus (strain MIT 9211) TaxID=93059 RepID=A9BCB9_PROM4|nr:Hsp70 family protein [Prochlorococcus marinus]ABX09481.1 putative DnaK-type molecular chaperone (HSP70 family) [Prochlorococcus marinus str. MIT 9211]
MGTLAIDLGSTTTVVAFQGERDKSVQLLDLKPISRIPGEVPSLIWKPENPQEEALFGYQVERLTLLDRNNPGFISDFKRWIGAPLNDSISWNYNLLPEEAGELLIKEIWKQLPAHIEIKRLVVTAPVETYKAYRKWLHKICFELDVKEIALVDEPTAAAIGAGQKGGSKLLVIDIGGSTTDISMVLLEGGEGQADPIAQLIRFNGEDLEGKSKQVLRCAKVLGKAGLRLGGRDLDKWISHYLFPDSDNSELILDAAEKLKCKLSNINLSETKKLTELALLNPQGEAKKLSLNRLELEELLQKNGLIKSLSKLLDKTLAQGSANGCELEDLSGVVLVGGGSRIPIIKKWLQQAIEPAKLITPPPIEAVAIGALSLTPGVRIKDVLHKGVSLRCWDQKTNQHIWHPLFLPGQPWPTDKPLEIILAASKGNQKEMDLKIADYEIDGTHEVVYINGIPMIRDEPSLPKLTPWEGTPLLIPLNPPGEEGEDCLTLRFSIDDHCDLIVEGNDIRNEKEIIHKNLGTLR